MHGFLLYTGKILLFILFALPELMLLYPIMRHTAKVPVRLRDFLLCTLLMACNLVTNRLLSMWASGLNILSSLMWFFILVRFVFGKRSWQCLIIMVKIVVLLSIMEALCMMVFALMGLMGLDQNKLMVTDINDLFKTENMFYFSLLNFTSILLLWLGIIGWDHIRSHHGRQKTEPARQQGLLLRALLRLSVLILTSLGMLTLPFVLFSDQSLIEFLITNRNQYILLTICSAGLMLVALSYMLQDIRYIIQLQRLNTLEQQQAISNSLLQNLRFFRHNMINMLYGLEGVLISGDRDKVTAYYKEMREKCALVNNENIVALERITNSSLSGVLLHAVDHARQINLPINLYVQDKVLFPRTLSDADLCQVLGVLLDNAIEAADKADERHVSMELRNVDDSLEIIVKNTYAGEVSPEKLTIGGASTKEGHEGQGLRSCYQILSRRKGAFLNFWVTGQYVQAQLLLGH